MTILSTILPTTLAALAAIAVAAAGDDATSQAAIRGAQVRQAGVEVKEATGITTTSTMFLRVGFGICRDAPIGRPYASIFFYFDEYKTLFDCMSKCSEPDLNNEFLVGLQYRSSDTGYSGLSDGHSRCECLYTTGYLDCNPSVHVHFCPAGDGNCPSGASFCKQGTGEGAVHVAVSPNPTAECWKIDDGSAINNLDNEISVLEDENSVLEDENSVLEGENTRLTRHNGNKNIRINNLEDENSVLEGENSVLEDENSVLEDENSELTRQNGNKNGRIRTLLNQVDAQTAYNVQQQTLIGQLNANINQLKEANTALKEHKCPECDALAEIAVVKAQVSAAAEQE